MPARLRLNTRLASLLLAVPVVLQAQAPAPVVVRVQGTVIDSVAMKPLVGALVRIVRADDPSQGRTATSDSSGAFRYDSVPAGVWLASFLHPTLDSLRLEPGVIRLEISESGTVMMPLGLPSARTLVVMVCGSRVASDAGVIIGEVRGAGDDAPLAGASVEVEWPEWVLGKKSLTTEMVRRKAVTDSLGRYTLCGAPSGSTLRAASWSAQDSAGVVEIAVPASGYAVQDFSIGRAEYVDAPADLLGAPAGAARLRRGRAQLRGQITTTSGAPLPSAIVRVIGSGSTVRTSATGEFRITDAVAGTQSVEVRAIGYSPARRTLRLTDGTEAEVAMRLAVRNVELDTVRVMAGREIPFDVQGIERRWRTGLGRFLDGKTVAERSTLYTTDALRGMPGVALLPVQQGFGQGVYMRNSMGQECRAMMFVDGMPLDAAGRGGLSLDETIRPDMVAAVEVYNRPTLVPAEYLTMARSCGVVAVWTKQGTGNVPVLPPKSSRR
ncbi:MAG: carboxypeptidase regulatory-like domain-containing protein [Gemmatimonadota bacterium]